MSDTIESRVQQCLARGYGTKSNEKKEVDVTLMQAMTDEIMQMLDKPLPETVVLAYEHFPAGSTIADLLDNLIIREGKRR